MDVSNVDKSEENSSFLGLNVMYFALPCSSLLTNSACYSDISDDDMSAIDLGKNQNDRYIN